MNNIKHASLPFKFIDSHPGSKVMVGAGARYIGDVTILLEGYGKEAVLEQDATAEFIVRACNNHYELLEALKAVVEYTGGDWEGDSIHEQIRLAIAKAEAINE